MRTRANDAQVSASDALRAEAGAVWSSLPLRITRLSIAHELHVSPRTVETHLAHAYAKLGIRATTELRQRRADLDLR